VHAVSFTAVSERDYWVLATGRCRCFTILRTTNGGTTFVRITAPPLPMSGTTPFLRFADRRDGFAFVPGLGGRFYATHDGGRTWRRIQRRTLLAFATGGGSVYVVTARCGLNRCSAYRLERASVAGGAWTSRPLPFAPAASVLELAAHGSDLWLLGTAVGDRQHDTLARSADGGRSFAVGAGPCYGDLGGRLEPTSASVVWAVCPTGLMAGAWRSTDGGATFAPLKTRGLVNSAPRARVRHDGRPGGERRGSAAAAHDERRCDLAAGDAEGRRLRVLDRLHGRAGGRRERQQRRPLADDDRWRDLVARPSRRYGTCNALRSASTTGITRGGLTFPRTTVTRPSFGLMSSSPPAPGAPPLCHTVVPRIPKP
jgi:hypothetical protein